MNSSICTLFENDYHFGVGSLINSLYAHGYRGIFWVGYRNALPPWAKPLQVGKNYKELKVNTDLSIRFIRLNSKRHFASYKPYFMMQLWRDFIPDADALFYFDPDILIKCRWSFYEEWVQYGICLCQDVNGFVPNDHPLRLKWKKFAEDKGYQCHRVLNQYFNSGFIGVSKPYRSALDLWADLVRDAERSGIDSTRLIIQDVTHAFHFADQDTFNLMAMITPHPLTTIGPEGMGFAWGGRSGFAMLHAIGETKPWRRCLIWEALKAKPPRLADKEYWRNTQFPLKLYNSFKLFLKRIDLLVASAIGRFYGRK